MAKLRTSQGDGFQLAVADLGHGTHSMQKKGNGRMNVVTMQYIRAMDFLRTLRDREEGQAMVEYGLLVAIISIAAIAFLPGIGKDISEAFKKVKEALEAAIA